MKTFHEWLAGRTAKNVGLWLNEAKDERRAVRSRNSSCGSRTQDWSIPAEPAAKEFGGQQELGKEAEACEAYVGRRYRDAQALQGNATGCVQGNSKMNSRQFQNRLRHNIGQALIAPAGLMLCHRQV